MSNIVAFKAYDCGFEFYLPNKFLLPKIVRGVLPALVIFAQIFFTRDSLLDPVRDMLIRCQ